MSNDLNSIMSTVSVIVSFVTAYFILNDYRFQKIKIFLEKLFWIEKFNSNKNKKKKLNGFYLEAKFFMLFYLVLFTQMLLNNIFSFSLQKLTYSVVIMIIYPLLYRLIMSIQRLIFSK
ncbi:MAG: hypothetical protein K0R31_290 [Clostridiales bacterium]|nr:hypothetical protein [Clostridiales bacterium]